MPERYHSKVDENVAKFGFHITYVMEDETGPSFCYSTGLYKTYKIPEVFISGLPQNLSFTMVANYAEKFKESVAALEKLNTDDVYLQNGMYTLGKDALKLNKKEKARSAFFRASRIDLDKVIQEEALAEAYGDMAHSSRSIDSEIDKAINLNESKAESDLAAMKQQLGITE